MPRAGMLLYKGTHRYTFRPGEIAEVLGIALVMPEGQEPRDCYHVRYPDGAEDWIPVSEVYPELQPKETQDA